MPCYGEGKGISDSLRDVKEAMGPRSSMKQ